MNEIIPRTAIDEIVAHRTQALSGVATAWDTLSEALKHARQAAPGQIYSTPSIRMDSRQWRQDREEVLAETRKQLDRGIWRHLMATTAFDRLMDKKAKEQLREQLERDPPEVTVETALATMGQLFEDRDLIFKRGVAGAFSALDRRFRSHDGFKIGSRVVLSHCFSEGRWNYYRRHDETLMDIERAFSLLDGKPQPTREEGIVGAVDKARGAGLYAMAFKAETALFRLVAFKNGNAHLWFERDDLLRKVNLLLADYYGAALGAGSAAAARTGCKHEPNRSPAKNHGFWETPEAVARLLLDAAEIHLPERFSGDYRPHPYTVLEPSAGKGALARLVLQAPGATLVCVEIQPEHARTLRHDLGIIGTYGMDFFDATPEGLGTFERIVMNPPFDGGRDIDHVLHALRFLKPGGRLASVMSAGVEFREDRKTVDFRATVERHEGRFHDLPPESFAASGTRVQTCIVTMRGA